MSKIYIIEGDKDLGVRLVNKELAYLTEDTLKLIGEYSCSLPTGTTIGKIWARNNNAFRPSPDGKKLKPDWWLGQYVDDPNPKQVGIVWRKIEIQPSCKECGDIATSYYYFPKKLPYGGYAGKSVAFCIPHEPGQHQHKITREEYESGQLVEA